MQCSQDISFVGFDGIRFVAHLDLPLTTLSQSMDRIGHQVVRLLLDVLNGRADAVQNVTLPHHLVVQASTSMHV